MTLDRFCIALILFHLPILWLPKAFLFVGIVIGTLVLILSVYLRSKLTAVLGLLVCIGYIQIIQVAKNAEKTTASKTPVQFEISKILKQTDYQTAIATLNTGEKIYLNWQSKQPLLLNQFYQAELALRPISARSNIGNFDRQRWYFANHINMTANGSQGGNISQN